MSAGTKRLGKTAREFNVGISTIVEFLHKKGFEIDQSPNAKISSEAYQLLVKEYRKDIDLKKESEKINLRPNRQKRTEEVEGKEKSSTDELKDDDEEPVVIIKDKTAKPQSKETAPPKIQEDEGPKAPLFKGPKVVGKIDIEKKPAPKPAQEKKEVPAAKVEKPKAEPIKPKVEEKPKEIKEEKVVGAEKPKMEEKAAKVERKEPVEHKSPKKEEVPKKDNKPAQKPHKNEKQEEKPKAETKVEAKPKVDPKESSEIKTDIPKVDGPNVVGKIDLTTINQRTRPPKKTKKQKEEERRARDKKRDEKNEKANADNRNRNNRNASEKNDNDKKDGGNNSQAKRKRRRIQQERVDINRPNNGNNQQGGGQRKDFKQVNKDRRNAGKGRRVIKTEVNDDEVQQQIKDTLARLTQKTKSKGAKHRRDKRQAASEKIAKQQAAAHKEKNVIKVTEFVSVSELASMMDVTPTEVISSCMSLGMFVSINQRLDAETMSLVAEEFGFKVEFISVEVQEAIVVEEDTDEDLEDRPPIVTVMGHVDHGKTSLLDYIRSANVIAGEAGGITQHIGAYNVELEDGRQITFLDTPGHEAFTAMRARGAQVTDIAIIIVAADDSVMPQTIEAINHAAAAGVPMVFAINKIDKPGANPEKIKEKLSAMNYLVEEWGGKYQSHDISAKNGIGIEDLLEKVLLEAEMLELKANPNKRATGSVIESSLDRGRGYVATVLVQNGTLREGDIILAGQYFGHVKAMFNERNQRIKEAGPAEPALILGLNGAPQAGDTFNVLETEREARQIANKREQLQREQGLRTQKHITLDEIGRRIAIGNFQELNIIVKGDVDGSIEALSDSLLKLSNEEIQVNIISKAVGQISEADVYLAAASDALIIGFQVRPSLQARKLAEKEEIEIRLYSIIYDAIEEVKLAMEGMLSPEIKEEITGSAEIQEVYKITKVGTIAGCICRDGKIYRGSKARVIRDGIVIYSGELSSLKRFKEDVKEVANGYECGMGVQNFNDLKVGDFIEAYKEVEVAKKLD